MKQYFKGKKIIVMGFGLHGGGVAVTNWLVKHGAKVLVTDLKTQSELGLSINKLDSKTRKKVTWVLGRHLESNFKQADIVIKNPAIPRSSKYLKLARRSGALIENNASLFFKYCSAPIIGVTGTRGKSTVASLLAELLQTAFAKTRKVWLVGLPQKPELAVLEQVKARDLVVVELSSWQLEILGEQKISPAGATITNIYPDHLNSYSGMRDYIAAKTNIFLHQHQSDFAVINFDNPETKKLGRLVTAKRFWFSTHFFPEQNGVFIKGKNIYFRNNGKVKILAKVSDIHLPGKHNLENILAALTVTGVYGVPAKKISLILKKFSGLPGRIELIKNENGIRFYNDTTATNPDGTIAALNTLGGKNKRIILIAGGKDKNFPLSKFKNLSKLIEKKAKAVILLKGDGSKNFKFRKASLPIIRNVGSMSDAVGLASALAKRGDIVLLSPACASFGLFINEYDRGDQFVAAVKIL